MSIPARIEVALDKSLTGSLLNGICNGAKGKSIRVVIGADGVYHIESKEMRITVEVDAKLPGIKLIRVYNEKNSATITAEDIESFGFKAIATDIVRELSEKYSPYRHSLADNIFVFGRTYGGGA